MHDLKPEVLLRFKALELVAMWEGRLVTNRLCEWFGISRQQASADIRNYQHSFNPDSLVYSPGIKGYEPAHGFQPALSCGHINEYLLLVAAHGSEPMAYVLEAHPNIAAVQLPDHAVQPEVVRSLIRACDKPVTLSIEYASMSSPEPHGREIVPHTLVYSGFRWHVRAWCHKRQAFRDFVVSRISSVPQPTKSPVITIEQDEEWNTHVHFRLVANPRLSRAQKELIARDYAMQQGALTISCRQALVHYSLQRYPVAMNEAQFGQPLVYPLCVHPDDLPTVVPALFGDGASR